MKRTPEALLLICLTGSIALGQNVLSQDSVIAPLPQPTVQTPEPFQIPRASDPSLLFAPPPPSPFEWGPLIAKPHFLYRYLYGDGVPVRPGENVITSINSLSPGILFNLGYWYLDYTPTWNIYSNSAFRDNVGEDERFGGLILAGSTSLKLNQSYSYSSEPLIETGRQTTEQSFSEVADLTHRFTQEILSETVVSEASRFAVGYPDSNDWSATQWLHYQFSTQLDTAIGIEGGLINVSSGTDIDYIQPQAQVVWSPVNKLSISGTAGVDHRTFLGTPRATLNTPTYNLSLQYNPFKWTGITLAAGRALDESVFLNESTKNTTWKGSVSQRLLGHFLFIGTVQEHDSDYIYNLTAKNAGREDNNLSYNLRLTWSAFKRGTISIIYLWDRNSSNALGYGFSSRQVGFELGCRF
jgi:hypothetical protein